MAGADGPRSFADLLAARAEEEHAAVLFEDEAISYRAFIAEAAARAALLRDARREGPFHVGVLLENVPEYLYWIGGGRRAGGAGGGRDPPPPRAGRARRPAAAPPPPVGGGAGGARRGGGG